MQVGDVVHHRGLAKRVTILQEFSSHYLCEDGSSRITCSKRPGVDLMEVFDGGLEQGVKPETINVNAATAEELSKFIKGLGKFSAREIVNRKPEGGYVNLNNLKDINPSLTVNWEEVGPKLQF